MTEFWTRREGNVSPPPPLSIMRSNTSSSQQEFTTPRSAPSPSERMQENPLFVNGLGSIKMSIRPLRRSPSRQSSSPPGSATRTPGGGLRLDSSRRLHVPDIANVIENPGLAPFAPGMVASAEPRQAKSMVSDNKANTEGEDSHRPPLKPKLPPSKPLQVRPRGSSGSTVRSGEVDTLVSDKPVSSSSCCLLHPQKSKFMKVWDLAMVIVLLLVAIVTPFEVAFLDIQIDGLFFVNRVVDALFLVDMVLQFFLAFRRPDGLWIFAHKRIAKRYLKGWFWIDLVSICPFDILGLFLQSDTVSNLRVLRIIRLARLAKLARMLHIGTIFRRWETALRIDYSFLSLFKFMSGMLVIAHWLACVWEIVAVFENISEDIEFTPEPGDYPSWQYYAGVVNKDAWTRYLVAVYFSLVTMATTGYGDIIPVTTVERWFVIFAMMLGAGIWTYIVANITNIVARLDREMHFKSALDDLNQYCSEHKLEAETREQLRTFMHQKRQIIQEVNPMKLLQEMSPALRSEVCKEVYGKWMQQVSYLRNFGSLEASIHSELALQLEHHVFAPQEMITRKALHVVEKGVVVKEGLILSSKSLWGEEMVLSSPILDSFTPIVRCLTFAELLVLERNRFYAVIAKYPAVHKQVRRAMLWLLLRRGIKVLSLVLRSYKTAVEESGPVTPPGQYTVAVSPDSSPTEAEAEAAATPRRLGNKERRWRSITRTHSAAQEGLDALRIDIADARDRLSPVLPTIPSASESEPSTSRPTTPTSGEHGSIRQSSEDPVPYTAVRRTSPPPPPPSPPLLHRKVGDEVIPPPPPPPLQPREKQRPPMPRLSETRGRSFSRSMPLLEFSTTQESSKIPGSASRSKTRKSILLHRAAELALGVRRWSKLPAQKQLEARLAAASEEAETKGEGASLGTEGSEEQAVDNDLQLALNQLHSIAQLSAPLRRRQEVFLASNSANTADSGLDGLLSPKDDTFLLPPQLQQSATVASPRPFGAATPRGRSLGGGTSLSNRAVDISALEEALWSQVKQNIDQKLHQ